MNYHLETKKWDKKERTIRKQTISALTRWLHRFVTVGVVVDDRQRLLETRITQTRYLAQQLTHRHNHLLGEEKKNNFHELKMPSNSLRCDDG